MAFPLFRCDSWALRLPALQGSDGAVPYAAFARRPVEIFAVRGLSGEKLAFTAVGDGLLQGRSDGTLDPAGSATRGTGIILPIWGTWWKADTT